MSLSPKLRALVVMALLAPLAGLQADGVVVPPAAPAAVDLYGDPLPEGAIARCGTVRLCHSPGNPRDLCFSPDGRLLASAGDGNAIVLWDAATGREQARLHAPQTAGFYSPLAFSPDSRYLAAGDKSCNIWLWNLKSNGAARRLASHQTPIAALAFSHDGKVLASAGHDNILQYPGRIPHLKLPQDRPVRLWDVASGKKLCELDCNGERVFSLVFVGDKGHLATSSYGPAISLWDVKSGVEAKHLWVAEKEVAKIWALDGQSVIGKLYDSKKEETTFVAWDTATGKSSTLPMRITASRDCAIAVSRDATKVAVSKRDALQVFELYTGKEIFRSARENDRGITLAISADGKILAIQGWPFITLLDSTTGKELLPPRPGHYASLGLACYLPDGKSILSVGLDGMARLWEASSGKEVRSFTVGATHNWQLSPDGRSLVGSDRSEKGALVIFDMAAGKEIKRWPWKARDAVFVFAPDGKTLAVSTAEEYQPKYFDITVSSVRLLDMATGAIVFDFGKVPCHVRSLAFSLDGKTLACGRDIVFAEDAKTQFPLAENDLVWLWDIVTGKKLHAVNGQLPRSPRFSPDGKTLLLNVANMRYAQDNGIGLWNVQTGKLLRDLPLAESSCFNLLCQSPDGKLLAMHGWTKGRNGTAIREMRTGKLVCILDDQWETADFSPDGKHIVTGGVGGNMLIWDLATLRKNAEEQGKLSADQLRDQWQRLGNGSSYEFVAAIDTLSGSASTVDFLERHLAPVDHGQLDKLITDLDANQYAVRQKALIELGKLEFAAKAPLEAALENQPTLEFRLRAEKLLHALEQTNPPAEWVRQCRAVIVLEQIGTPKARRLLEKLAGGAAAARLTQEAQAALQRLQSVEAAAR